MTLCMNKVIWENVFLKKSNFERKLYLLNEHNTIPKTNILGIENLDCQRVPYKCKPLYFGNYVG